MSQKIGLLLACSLAFLLSGVGTEASGQQAESKAIVNRLTGTWSLDASRSDDVRAALDRALRDRGADSDQVLQRLERRLQPPDRLAIEQSGRRITIGSSNARKFTFDADGRSRAETSPNGRSVQTTATLTGSRLTVSTQGDRGSDFNVIFEPIDKGRTLQVTRRIYSDRMTEPAEVNSFYSRVSDSAQLEEVSGPSAVEPGDSRRRSDRAAIPSGTTVTAVLNESLNTKVAAEGDRFTMTVREPTRYDGAVIEGYLTRVERSGRVSGKPELGLEFDSIRLRDGGTYDYAGLIEQVRTSDNKKVSVDNEGGVKEKSGQTERTATRAGVGAAVGAIIGGIAGGGKGAAIGAGIGAGAGAGSVFIQGRDDLDLASGTEFVIQTTSRATGG